MIPFGYENPTQVEFVDEGQQMTMTVEGDQFSTVFSSDEELDYEEDQEVGFKETLQSEIYSDTELDEDEGEISESDSAIEQNDSQYPSTSDAQTQGNMKQRQMSPQQRNKRIKELDAEMQDRLKEIRALLDDGGLKPSVQEVNKIQQNSKHKMVQGPKSVNFNLNSNKGGVSSADMRSDKHWVMIELSHQAENSKSDETIYENAIPLKDRLSSSSKEAYITDSSDEFLNAHFNDMQVIDDSVVENRSLDDRCKCDDRSRQKTRRDDNRSPRASTLGGSGYHPRP